VIVGVAHDDQAQGALARAIGSHQGMRFTFFDRQVDPAQDWLAVNFNMQILDFENITHRFHCSKLGSINANCRYAQLAVYIFYMRAKAVVARLCLSLLRLKSATGIAIVAALTQIHRSADNL